MMQGLLQFLCVLLIIRPNNGRRLIINGKMANADDYPFIVGIYKVSGQRTIFSCTGALIKLSNPLTVLTAAHCLDGVSEYRGLFSKTTIFSNSDPNDIFAHLPATGYVVHPNYTCNTDNNFICDNDIGLLIFNISIVITQEQIDTVVLDEISLPPINYEFNVNTRYRTLGYGVQEL